MNKQHHTEGKVKVCKQKELLINELLINALLINGLLINELFKKRVVY